MEQSIGPLEASQAAVASGTGGLVLKNRAGSGTRFSGTPLWRFTQRRDELQKTLGEEELDATVPDGFEPRNDGWHFHPKHNIYWRASTRRYYRLNEFSKSYNEIVREPSAEKELRLMADASSAHERVREDRHVIVRDLSKAAQAMKMPIDHLAKPAALFAVYDGHRPVPGAAAEAGAGEASAEEAAPPTCAEFCARNFHLKLLPRLTEFRGPWDDIQMTSAIRQSFDELDADYLARSNGAMDGSSAVIVLLTGRRLYVASVGDAVCFLGQEAADGSCKLMKRSFTHVPSMPTEMGRIASAGGEVIVREPGGRKLLQARAGDATSEALHVSRAFGDRAFKSEPPAPEEGDAPKAPPKSVIATPDVTTIALTNDHRALVLGSAEMSLLSEERIAEVLWKRRGHPRVTCSTLVREMQAKATKDASLTAMCIFLSWEASVPTVEVAPTAKKARTDLGPSAKASQVRCRQILVKHKDCKEPVDKVRGDQPVTRSLADAERILLESLEAIEANTGRNIFTQRCKAVSECSSSLKGGEMAGDLGWLTRGQAHAAVEAAAFALPVGHLSDIVESDEGAHVLWRIA